MSEWSYDLFDAPVFEPTFPYPPQQPAQPPAGVAGVLQSVAPAPFTLSFCFSGSGLLIALDTATELILRMEPPHIRDTYRAVVSVGLVDLLDAGLRLKLCSINATNGYFIPFDILNQVAHHIATMLINIGSSTTLSFLPFRELQAAALRKDWWSILEILRRSAAESPYTSHVQVNIVMAKQCESTCCDRDAPPVIPPHAGHRYADSMQGFQQQQQNHFMMPKTIGCHCAANAYNHKHEQTPAQPLPDAASEPVGAHVKSYSHVGSRSGYSTPTQDVASDSTNYTYRAQHKHNSSSPRTKESGNGYTSATIPQEKSIDTSTIDSELRAEMEAIQPVCHEDEVYVPIYAVAAFIMGSPAESITPTDTRRWLNRAPPTLQPAPEDELRVRVHGAIPRVRYTRISYVEKLLPQAQISSFVPHERLNDEVDRRYRWSLLKNHIMKEIARRDT